ncbi:hypothetical protein [Phyllobacterium myrsinacearum]|uniref:Uncharacterized protein YgiM (DUF1202 family) n=1 Tax=Phyllobacterium myrsinacearum TaxID=28101 RepID=A0A839EI02_9HYPH|nr:hypothetical protein [Phyllobacterium myrsinacearum]MBA8879621.1 uncharacterized protein YgiM (DUF1202 family) [Phyllobacterium myrsinacearum]
MAKRKRSTRSSSRAPKRSSSQSASRRSSTGTILALAVIVGVGALSIWQHKGSQTILSRLFERSAAHSSQPPAAKLEASVKQSAKIEPRQEDSRTNSTPIPRPSIAVGAQPQNPVVTKPVQRPHRSVGPVEKADIRVPRGVNMPNMAPSVVYARERLTLRRNAWDKSAPAGTVEKGREMRSYSKTGKWHRVVVPATDMIGWVHEDMLVAGKARPGVSSMATGAISREPELTQVQAVYPPRPVGTQ